MAKMNNYCNVVIKTRIQIPLKLNIHLQMCLFFYLSKLKKNKKVIPFYIYFLNFIAVIKTNFNIIIKWHTTHTHTQFSLYFEVLYFN